MVSDGDERRSQPPDPFDDSFDDLDKFFFPAEEGDWADSAEGAGSSQQRESESGEERQQVPEELQHRVDAGSEHPAGEPRVSQGAGAGEEAEPERVGASALGDEPTGEMEAGDWTSLRGILQDDDEDEYDLDFGDDSTAGQNDTTLLFDDIPAAGESVDSPVDLPERVEARGDDILVQSGQPPAQRQEPPPPGDAPTGAVKVPWEELSDDLLAPAAASPPRTVKVGDPESLMGPVWEEPSSHAVSADAPPAGRRGERNLPAAVITAAVLLAAALLSIAVSKAAFAVVAGAVVLLAQAELYATMHRRGYQPASALGLLVGALMLGAAYLRGEPAVLFVVALALMLCFFWYMVSPPKARAGMIRHVGATLAGIIYVPFLGSFLLLILPARSGRALVLAVLGLTFLYDTAAFFVGSTWGNRPLARTISPKKSWEGVIGASAVTLAMSIAVLPSIDPIKPSWARAVGMALVVSVFATLGDLVESAIKRDLDVKDMGRILPGHGGILDRIDAALFVAPAAFYFLRLIL